MARPELGIKRICGQCGTRFYDLGRDPIVCPKCGATYDVTTIVPSRTKATPAEKAPVAAVEETEIEDADEDLVALEDVDAEEEDTGRATPEIEEDEIPDIEDEELGEDEEDEFLDAEEDEETDDVSGLIDGELPDDEET